MTHKYDPINHENNIIEVLKNNLDEAQLDDLVDKVPLSIAQKLLDNKTKVLKKPKPKPKYGFSTEEIDRFNALMYFMSEYEKDNLGYNDIGREHEYSPEDYSYDKTLKLVTETALNNLKTIEKSKEVIEYRKGVFACLEYLKIFKEILRTKDKIVYFNKLIYTEIQHLYEYSDFIEKNPEKFNIKVEGINSVYYERLLELLIHPVTFDIEDYLESIKSKISPQSFFNKYDIKKTTNINSSDSYKNTNNYYNYSSDSDDSDN